MVIFYGRIGFVGFGRTNWDQEWRVGRDCRTGIHYGGSCKLAHCAVSTFTAYCATRSLVSDNAPEIGRNALVAGGRIYCDAEMVSRGIITRALPEGCGPIVTLNDPAVPALAQEMGTTRSAAAVELWRPGLEGAIVVIGNAPTALFHLLAGLEAGWPKPALIIGMPVGFVGAAESKVALAASAPVPFITVHGRRGGSALASAAVNALSLGLGGDGT